MHIPICRTVPELRAAIAGMRRLGFSVGFAPTMGALHEGHLSLVRLLKARTDRVVASIFVNPKQFAAHEDLGAYPRDEAGDVAKLASAGCDLVFAPHPEVMYPAEFNTSVSVSGVSAPLEGEARPHFFGGVATVVTKLLLQCLPDVAAFGEKDYQQLLVIRRLVKDLDIPVEILAGETVREADGLAMSSRNAYLTADERAIAGKLNLVMREAAAAIVAGAPAQATLAEAQTRLVQLGFSPIDYVSLCDTQNLSPADRAPARLLVAAWLGRTRLIDNFPVG